MKKFFSLSLFLLITSISNAQVYHNIAVGFSSSGYFNAIYQTDFRRIEIGAMLSFNPNLTSFIEHKHKFHIDLGNEVTLINNTPNKFFSGSINAMCGGYIGKGFSVGGLLGVNYTNYFWDIAFMDNKINLTKNEYGIDVGAYLQYRFNMFILQCGYTYRSGTFFNVGIKI